MSNVTINLTKWYHFVLGAIPLVAVIATTIMWIDTRYMHREISDTRFIEMQLRLVQMQVRQYNTRIKAGEVLTPEEQIQFDLDKDQLKLLLAERNKILGIGEDE